MEKLYQKFSLQGLAGIYKDVLPRIRELNITKLLLYIIKEHL